MRQLKFLAFTAILVLSSFHLAAGQNIAGQNLIRNENASGGTEAWQIKNAEAATDHQVEGYASQTSVNVGEPISFHLRAANATAPIYFTIYRLGFYQGKGGKEVKPPTAVYVVTQLYPEPDAATGLAECNWPSPAGANWPVPSNALSGVYLVKMTSGGLSSYISFVVRDDARKSDVLFQRSVTTDEAYNNYPGTLYGDVHGNPTDDYRNGKSLYEFNTGGTPLSGTDPIHQAKKVSFNRPFGILSNSDLTGGGVYQTAGGTLFTYDFQMIRWMESKAYDVTYCTNVDTDTADDLNGRLAAGQHKAFLSVGHDEYWSWKMRDNIETARDRPTGQLNLGFFSANTCYWQIRFEDSLKDLTQPLADRAERTIVAYKEHARDLVGGDPDFEIADKKHLTTNLWRRNQFNGDQQFPTGSLSKPPEDQLIGVMSNYDPDTPLADGSNPAIISPNCPTWITQGTQGDPLDDLIGYEVDRYQNQYSGRALDVVAVSPFYNNLAKPPVLITRLGDSNMTHYKVASNNAHVFATGSMQWTWGLDNFNADPNVEPVLRAPRAVHDAKTITANVMNCLLDIYPRCAEASNASDLAVWRPGPQAVWFVMGPGYTLQAWASWGVCAPTTICDIPAPGDYDGDGKTDFCVFRPGDNTWYITFSSTGGMAGIPFGTAGDVIAPADYDGDGKTDIAVFRPGPINGTWFYRRSSDQVEINLQFGLKNDVPAPADYDGDRKADITVWRNTDHTFYTTRSSDSGIQSATFGSSGYKPVPGNYDGDLKADYALFHSDQVALKSYFDIRKSITAVVATTEFGDGYDIPVPNDYDGDGKCDIAVWRDSTGTWYIEQSGSGGSLRSDHWGISGDIPVPSNYRR